MYAFMLPERVSFDDAVAPPTSLVFGIWQIFLSVAAANWFTVSHDLGRPGQRPSVRWSACGRAAFAAGAWSGCPISRRADAPGRVGPGYFASTSPLAGATGSIGSALCSPASNMYIAGTTNSVNSVPIDNPVKITSPIE